MLSHKSHGKHMEVFEPGIYGVFGITAPAMQAKLTGKEAEAPSPAVSLDILLYPHSNKLKQDDLTPLPAIWISVRLFN